jgi:toxin FitB
LRFQTVTPNVPRAGKRNVDMFLLDTNIVSELRKIRPHGAVIAWYANSQQESRFISAVSLYELQKGVEQTRKQDIKKAFELDMWISGLQRTSQILPFGGLESRMTAKLMRGLSEELLEDAMIAATAVVHRLTIATRNTRDFESFGVPLINPFEFQ